MSHPLAMISRPKYFIRVVCGLGGIVASVALFSASEACAQSVAAFHLQPSAAATNPEPTKQTPEERTKTLRACISEVMALIDKKEYKKFFYDYIDPFWLARGAAGGKESVDELIAKVVNDPKTGETWMKRFKEVLERSLSMEPVWLLDGRVASFMTGHNSHTAEFWIYYEGKWRISPET
jgi:hypothetical protein